MKTDLKEGAVSSEKEHIVNLGADAQDIIIPVSSEEKIILNFPLAGISARNEGRNVVLECLGGQCVYLAGALENMGATIVLADGRVLTVDALMDLLAKSETAEEASVD